MISSDHRSPSKSSDMLTGQPERRLDTVIGVDFRATRLRYQDHLRNASKIYEAYSNFRIRRISDVG